MKNYVISLKTATDRREHIINEFGKQNIKFEFFDAVTPNNLNEIAKSLQIDLNKNIDLSNNELSCLCSHLILWKKSVEENIDYITIFEDDIYLSQDAHLFLTNKSWIPKECDFIKIEKATNKAHLTNYTTVYTHQLSRLKSIHVNAGGYILSNSGASILYQNFLALSDIDHVDQFLFKTVLTQNIIPIYQINPTLCIQDYILYPNNQKFTSSLQWRDKQRKVMLSPCQKFIRELKRPCQQLKDSLQQTKLEFKL